MAQHVMLFNALSPSDKQGWDTIDAELSCERARDVDAINLLISRSQAERAESGLMQRVSIVRFESQRLGRAVWALANCCVLATERGSL